VCLYLLPYNPHGAANIGTVLKLKAAGPLMLLDHPVRDQVQAPVLSVLAFDLEQIVKLVFEGH
jgi:hypothetical protein